MACYRNSFTFTFIIIFIIIIINWKTTGQKAWLEANTLQAWKEVVEYY
jgi:hypothetical protein